MDFVQLITNNIEKLIPIIRTIIIVVVSILIFNSILFFVKKRLLKRAKTKKQKSNVEIFHKVLKYLFILIILLFAVFSYAGSWVGFGLSVGLLSAALGWALQKPITGIAGWIMLIIKRPFEIGDRIIIGDVRGDVIDLTLTHIYIAEIGGIVKGEETSGRIIMVPNSLLFEKSIINYTQESEYVLDQVAAPVTFESDLDKVEKIFIESAKKYTRDVIKITKKQPYLRTYFQAHGILVHVRYMSPAKRIQEISSTITREIHKRMMQTKGVELAYQHTEVLFRKKK